MRTRESAYDPADLLTSSRRWHASGRYKNDPKAFLSALLGAMILLWIIQTEMLGQKYYGLRGTKLTVAIGIIAGMDFLLFGYDQGVMGGLLTLQSFLSVFPQIDTTNASGASSTATRQGITIGSYNLGCFAGAIVCIWLGDILGRRRTIFLGSSIMVIGAAIQASSFTLGQLIAGRVITGLGNGLNTSTVPTWQSETSKPHKRGQMVMIEGALIAGGIMLSYWIDLGFSFVGGSASWRVPIAFQIVFALLILTFILGLPESPRWLILKGKEDEAINVLAVLNEKEVEDESLISEFDFMKATVLEQSQAGFRELFTMGKDRNFHRAALGYVNQMFQQISGINLITYYAPVIYKNSIQLGDVTSRILAACNGTEYFAASWVAVFTIEKFGRRSLMLFGATGMSISMAILAGTTSVGGTGAGVAAAVFLFVFNTFFAIGWLGMTWLYPSEIVPLRIRGPSSALSTSANWIFNFLVVMITPISFASIGYQTYIIFAVINAFIVPCVYFFYPETAYRSLEEMDDIFKRSDTVFDAVRLARPSVTPNRFDKNGNFLMENVDEDKRRSSAAEPTAIEDKDDSRQNESYYSRGGLASGSGTTSEKDV